MCNGCAAFEDKLPEGIVERSTFPLPVCMNPPEGAFALSEGTTTKTLTLDEGYYRHSPLDHKFQKCNVPEACPGGETIINGYNCASGYEDLCEEVESSVGTCTIFIDFCANTSRRRSI